MNSAGEAVVTLPLQGPTGQPVEVESVVDTGYNGFLTLPTELVAELGLAYQARSFAVLADGSGVAYQVYTVSVLWDGQPRQIDAPATGDTPMIGMAMLEGHNLNIDVEIGGRVLIRANA